MQEMPPQEVHIYDKKKRKMIPIMVKMLNTGSDKRHLKNKTF